MKRRDARNIVFRLTYEMIMRGEYVPETFTVLTENADSESLEFIRSVTEGIAAHKDELKTAISTRAHGYDYNRIYKTDLAALLVACYEIMYTDTPVAVAVNEAVEFVKTYSDVQSYSFVNGILASVIADRS